MPCASQAIGLTRRCRAHSDALAVAELRARLPARQRQRRAPGRRPRRGPGRRGRRTPPANTSSALVTNRSVPSGCRHAPRPRITAASPCCSGDAVPGRRAARPGPQPVRDGRQAVLAGAALAGARARQPLGDRAPFRRPGMSARRAARSRPRRSWRRARRGRRRRASASASMGAVDPRARRSRRRAPRAAASSSPPAASISEASGAPCSIS